jgi:peptidoglycan/LPS O-acetylase OafA/YrhL
MPALDGLRGMAVLMVVALHAGFVVHPQGRGLAQSYVPGGLFGVDVFFVLSGFLITALLLQEHRGTGVVSFRNFYLRRACRLLPALAALLAVDLAYAAWDGRSLRHEVEAVGSITFYVSNITQSLHLFMPAELAHTWSLAVEEQFYILWPAALLMILAWQVHKRGSTSRVVPWALPIGIAATVIVRIVVWRTMGYPAAYELPFCRSDCLLIGCALAFLYHHGRLPRKGAAMAGWLGVIALLALAFFWNEADSSVYYGGFTLIALLAAAVINGVMVESRGLTAAFSWRPLVAVGRVSYGLYLWNVMILSILVQHTFGLAPWPRVVLGLGLTAAATWASWVVIEKPALRLKNRFGSVSLRRELAVAPA